MMIKADAENRADSHVAGDEDGDGDDDGDEMMIVGITIMIKVTRRVKGEGRRKRITLSTSAAFAQAFAAFTEYLSSSVARI